MHKLIGLAKNGHLVAHKNIINTQTHIYIIFIKIKTRNELTKCYVIKIKFYYIFRILAARSERF